MGCPTECEIGANLTFSVCTHDPDTGVLTDADAVPAYRIYEDETGAAILNDNMAKLDDANTTGFYTALIAVTAGNGFENGKTYTVYIEATVGGDEGGICYAFKAYDYRAANVTAMAANVLTAAAIANAAIDNATFAADVGSTAHGTNIIALACRKILEELNLDHLLKVDTTVAADGDLEAYCVAGTIMGHLLSTSADATLYKASTDSMQGIRDHIGDGTNLPEAGGDGDHLTESGGTGDQLTAINLPNQTMDIVGNITGNLSGSVGSLTGHTNQTGDSFARLGAPAGASVSADIAAVPTAAEVKTAMEADAGDLSSLMEALVNKRIWKEADGELEMFNDAGASQGKVAAQVSTDGTFTTAKRAFL